jgi:exonuclease III
MCRSIEGATTVEVPIPEALSDHDQHDETFDNTRQPPALNTTNLRTNVVYGHEMVLPKPENTTRLASLNVNGIRRGDDYQDVLGMAQALKTSSVDWGTFSETKIDWRSAARGKMYEKIQRVYHHARISTSSSSIRYDTLYQPGGTMTLVTDNYTSRVKSMGHDSALGRWSYTFMTGRHGRIIILVTVYNVCNQPSNRSGSRTAHTQQHSLLLRQGRTINPRKAFLDDFDHQVTVWRDAGHELIIAGDFNEELGTTFLASPESALSTTSRKSYNKPMALKGNPPRMLVEEKDSIIFSLQPV